MNLLSSVPVGESHKQKDPLDGATTLNSHFPNQEDSGDTESRSGGKI